MATQEQRQVLPVASTPYAVNINPTGSRLTVLPGAFYKENVVSNVVLRRRRDSQLIAS
jgi:hypothetical protein